MRFKSSSQLGNTLAAGDVRLNVADALAGFNRVMDAEEYARAALRDFESVGASAAERAEYVIQYLEAKKEMSPEEYRKRPRSDRYFPVQSGGRHVKLYKLGK